MAQKRIIKTVTKRFVTEIIQESTDAIYKFEDDSISLADKILKQVLESEIKSLASAAIRDSQKRQKSSRNLQRSNTSNSDPFDIPSEYDGQISIQQSHASEKNIGELNNMS